MITELRAENFKSWKDTGMIRFAPLTGFFGANGTGKTSILQVLLMLKQTVERPSDWNEPLYFGDENSLVNLGSFEETVHQHDKNLSLDISVAWKIPETKYSEQMSTDSLSFSTSIVKRNDGRDLVEYCYTANGQKWKIERGPQNYTFRFPDFLVKTGYTAFSPGAMMAKPFRCYGVVDREGRLNTLLTNQDAFENLFSQIHYTGPLREYPRHNYAWEGENPESTGQRGEKAIPVLLSGRVQLLSIEKQILEWLRRLDLIYSFRLQPNVSNKGLYEFRVTKYKGGPEVRLTDVGFGASQVLPVLVLCYYVPDGSILILEHPEGHLHPNAQSKLADVLIDVVKNRNIQVILESHSENLLIRLMRRIAEEKIPMEHTALYSCEINNGTSEIQPLIIDNYGNISNWPQNFFGDEMGDLAAKAKAEIERRKANEQWR